MPFHKNKIIQVHDGQSNECLTYPASLYPICVWSEALVTWLSSARPRHCRLTGQSSKCYWGVWARWLKTSPQFYKYTFASARLHPSSNLIKHSLFLRQFWEQLVNENLNYSSDICTLIWMARICLLTLFIFDSGKWASACKIQWLPVSFFNSFKEMSTQGHKSLIRLN